MPQTARPPQHSQDIFSLCQAIRLILAKMPTVTRSSVRSDEIPQQSPRPRAGWIAVLCLSFTTAAAVAMFAAAWILGGRVLNHQVPPEALLPPEDEQGLGHGTSLPTSPSASSGPAAGPFIADRQRQSGEVLPGAAGGGAVHTIPAENLTALKQLGWSVPHLSNAGFTAQRAETTISGGVRTVHVEFSRGDYYLNVSETRPEAEGSQLIAVSEKLEPLVDLESAEQLSLQLGTGEEASLYSFADEVWTVTIESEEVQYVITSDLPESEVTAAQVAGWVMITDHSRVEFLPNSPSGGDRLERGFEELFSWLD